MAGKKRGAAKKTAAGSVKTAGQARLKDRINIAWKNLIIFLIIFVISFALYWFSSNDLFKNFFGILWIIFGFLAFAFLIAFIVLLILRAARK